MGWKIFIDVRTVLFIFEPFYLYDIFKCVSSYVTWSYIDHLQSKNLSISSLKIVQMDLTLC